MQTKLKEFDEKINLPNNDYIYYLLAETAETYRDDIDQSRKSFVEYESEIQKLRDCKSVFKDHNDVLKFIDSKSKSLMDLMIKESDNLDELNKKLELVLKAKKELGQ